MRGSDKRFRIIIGILASAALIPAGCGESDREAAGSKTAQAVSGESKASAPRAAVAAPVTLPEGTSLKVRLITALSTNTHQTGDSFEASLEEPLIAGGRTIAPRGATVRGKVVEADKGGRVQGRATIAVQLTALETSSGRVIDLTTASVSREAAATKGDDAKKVGIGAGVGAAIGAIAGGGKGAAIGAAAGAGAGSGAVLVTRGDPAVLPSETVLTFQLLHPIRIS